MKKYRSIPRRLYGQLLEVAASRKGRIEYRPCAVELDDGRVLNRVYIVEQSAYLAIWGVHPEDDRGKRALPIESVRRIWDSPERLPARLADELYRVGETGMGYYRFVVTFRGGFERAFIAGSAVDFIDPPPGVSASDAVAVRISQGILDGEVQPPTYYWCLYDGVGV